MGEDEHGPLRGWAPVGQRLHNRVPYGHWRTMTFLAALRCDRIDAPCVLDQPVNAQSFTDDIEQCLMPTLSPGDVVHHGQPLQPQETRHAQRHPCGWCQAPVPAAPGSAGTGSTVRT